MIVGKKNLKSSVPKTKENNGKFTEDVSVKKTKKRVVNATGGKKTMKVLGGKAKIPCDEG